LPPIRATHCFSGLLFHDWLVAVISIMLRFFSAAFVIPAFSRHFLHTAKAGVPHIDKSAASTEKITDFVSVPSCRFSR